MIGIHVTEGPKRSSHGYPTLPHPIRSSLKPSPPFFCPVPAGVRALLNGSTSLLSLNVEGCYRLYGCQIATTEGFDAQEDPGRPGVLMRWPPSTAAAAAGSGGGGGRSIAQDGGCVAVMPGMQT